VLTDTRLDRAFLKTTQKGSDPDWHHSNGSVLPWIIVGLETPGRSLS
jgi:hypothetical protein